MASSIHLLFPWLIGISSGVLVLGEITTSTVGEDDEPSAPNKGTGQSAADWATRALMALDEESALARRLTGRQGT